MRVSLIHSRMRVEEKAIGAALAQRGAEVAIFQDTQMRITPGVMPVDGSTCVNRSMSYFRSMGISAALEAKGTRVLNSHAVATICGDKLRSSAAFEEAGIPIPGWGVAFSAESALETVETLGYPCVLKPIIGSWGRLISRVENRVQAESVIEHKAALSSPYHSVFYAQEYIRKPGRDIRAFVVGDECIGAIYRESEEWITNLSRGADARPCALSDGLADLSIRAAQSVGGGMIAVDILETESGELLVLEVNHAFEFRRAQRVVDFDIAGRMADYVVASAS